MSEPTGKYSITMPRAIAEAEHGPVTDEEILALRDQLHQARGQQKQGGADAA